MPDCPHIHIQDSGLQAFREIISEETDGGRTIARFLNDAVEGRLPDFEPQHRLKAAKMLKEYGSEKAERFIRTYSAPKRPRTASVPSGSAQSEGQADRDPIMDSFEDDIARAIRQETGNGLSIVNNLIHIMETREDPYKPQHNLEAARQLTDNGFPPTDALICPPECTHHSPAHPERSGAESKDEGDEVEDLRSDEERWAAIEADLKRLEEQGILTPDPDAPPIDISIYRMPKDFDSAPYEKEEAAAFWAEIDLRVERQKQWPEIEERRRKKLAQIYPSHSEDDDDDPPET